MTKLEEAEAVVNRLVTHVKGQPAGTVVVEVGDVKVVVQWEPNDGAQSKP